MFKWLFGYMIAATWSFMSNDNSALKCFRKYTELSKYLHGLKVYFDCLFKIHDIHWYLNRS